MDLGPLHPFSGEREAYPAIGSPTGDAVAREAGATVGPQNQAVHPRSTYAVGVGGVGREITAHQAAGDGITRETGVFSRRRA